MQNIPRQPSTLSALFPPSPPFTSLAAPITGHVVLITGTTSGIGLELAKILYLSGATVYLGGRSVSSCDSARVSILSSTQVQEARGVGRLENLVMDLSDLSSVKGAAEAFLAREERLDVLVHNAGVMTPAKGSTDAHGHDLEMTTNALAPFLLTTLLSPLLTRTAGTAPKDTVRVVFVTSLLQSGVAAGAMDFDNLGSPRILEKPMQNYMQSKVGGTWLAVEFGRRLGAGSAREKGVLCVSLHPGLISTKLQRNWPLLPRFIMGLIFKPPVYGAYAELYAAFSPDITSLDNGGYLMAWGRKGVLPPDILAGTVTKGLQGGSGTGKMERFIQWCERESKSFL